MEFRRLTPNEFNKVQEDFERFLSLNGVKISEWENLRNTAPQKMSELFEAFSDRIIEAQLNRTEYLHHLSQNMIRVYEFHPEKLIMNVLLVKDKNIGIDFRDKATLSRVFSGDSSIEFHLEQQEKVYEVSKAKEIFALLDIGCRPASKAMFLAIEKLNIT